MTPSLAVNCAIKDELLVRVIAPSSDILTKVKNAAVLVNATFPLVALIMKD